MEKISKEQAIAKGYAGFNDYPHVCLDIDESMTISLKLPNGKLATFCAMPNAGCIDIHLSNHKNNLIHFSKDKKDERIQCDLSTLLI